MNWELLSYVQTSKIGSLVDVQDSEDPEGMRVFYYLVQDLKVELKAFYPFPRTLSLMIAVAVLPAPSASSSRSLGCTSRSSRVRPLELIIEAISLADDNPPPSLPPFQSTKNVVVNFLF